MIDEHRQDLAAEYALDSLETGTARAFEAELTADPELRVLTDELRESAASLAYTAPGKLPSPELRQRILSTIRAEAAAATSPAPVQRSGPGLLPWVLAAGFALTTAAIWYERDQWRDEAVALRSETIELREKDALAKIRITTLSAQIETFAQSSAVVVWDPATQRGIIKLANLPKPESGKDYQLWVIDPKYPQPVSGGVLPLDNSGTARVAFSPVQPIKKADKFAISVEPSGGVPQATGPIVLIGN